MPVTGVAHEPPWGFSQVLRAWPGQTVAIVAGGPSVTQEAVDRLRGRCRVIVINDSYRLAPWADVHYFGDRKWYEQHCNVPGFEAFRGERATLQVGHWDDEVVDGVRRVRFVEALHYLQRDGQIEGLSADSRYVRTGNNSGHQALNIAVHSGASTILLLGYDAGVPKGSKKHWFGDHWDHTEPPYETMRSALRYVDHEAKKLGVRIVNCSPVSLLTCFEKATLESVLPDKATAAVPG